MSQYFRISATFIDPLFHGRADAGQPEWPPSPLRLLQAVVAANGDALWKLPELEAALNWLESRQPPIIVAPSVHYSNGYVLSVPNNAMDLVGKAWARGNYFGKGDADPATHRTMKTVRPVRMLSGDAIHFLWPIHNGTFPAEDSLKCLQSAIRRVYSLGWGLDFVAVEADVIPAETADRLPGERWKPGEARGGVPLRVPMQGTLAALREKHAAFLVRVGIGGKQMTPVPALSRFNVVGYRRSAEGVQRPYVVFELREIGGTVYAYPSRRLMHLAGMTRYLAKSLMSNAPPAGTGKDWVDRYVLGHRDSECESHRQFAYVPLPSIGHRHADQNVRRIMVIGTCGDEGWLHHLAGRLAGQQLVPELGNEFHGEPAPYLHRVYRDNVARFFVRPANRWASVTPVILPGHDDHKPAKTQKLIEAALAHAGIEQPCTFEWSAYSRFAKSYSAHKYDKNGKPIGYLRPDHLLDKTAVHLTLRFEEGVAVPGPLTIGAGRHCGFGLMAGIGE